MELKEHYQQYVDNYSAEVATLKRKNRPQFGIRNSA